MLDVLGESVRREIRKGPKRLNLQHVKVGVALVVATEVRICPLRVKPETLQEQLAVEIVSCPAERVHKADLLLRSRRSVLPELDVLRSPRPTRVVHICVAP